MGDIATEFGLEGSKSSTRPGPGFKKQASEFKDRVEGPVPYVQCIYLVPSYEILGEDGLRYYFYWRTCILEGDCPKTDIGHLCLFIYESMVIGRDFETISSAVSVVKSVSALPAYAVDRLMFDLCMYYGRPVPGWVCCLDLHRMEILATYRFGTVMQFQDGIVRMTRMITEPRPKLMSWCGYSESVDRYLEGLGDVVILDKMVNCGLRALDGYVRRHEGVSLIESVSDGLSFSEFVPLEDIAPRKLTLVEHHFNIRDGFDKVLEEVLMCCVGKLYGQDCGKPDKSFRTDFAEVVSKAVSDIYSAGAWDAVPVQLPVCRKGDEGGYGIIMRQGKVKGSRSPLTLEQIEEYHDAVNTTPCPFKPSGFRNPSFEDLSPGSLQYYLYWRTSIGNNIFPPTDGGYMWLYESELVNSREPPEVVTEKFAKVIRSYSEPGRRSDLVAGVKYRFKMSLLVYSVAKGLPFPPPDLCEGWFFDNLNLVRFLYDGTCPPDREFIMRLAGLSEGRRASIGYDVVEIVCNVLFRMQKGSPWCIFDDYIPYRARADMHISGAAPLFDIQGTGKIITSMIMGIRFEVKYEGDELLITADGLPYTESRYAHSQMKSLVAEVIKVVGEYRCSKFTEHSKNVFKTEISGIVREEVERYFSDSAA